MRGVGTVVGGLHCWLVLEAWVSVVLICGQSGGRGAGFGAGGGHVMFYIDTFHSHIHKHTFNGVKMLLLAFFEPKEPLLFCSI